MGEYIEREAAIAALDEFRLNETVSKYATVMQCKAARDAISRATKALESLPAADVEPLKRGRWLTWEEMFPGETSKRKNNLGVFCDQCRNHADNMSDYCPNCGAKMDLEGPNEA